VRGSGKTVAFFTLGCKLNQFETYDLERQFVGRGYRVVPFGESASVYVVNTCTVTGKSDYRCRQTIRKARKRSPGAKVVAVGCYAQTQPGVLAGMPEVDLVLGNSEKGDIFSHLDRNGTGRVQVGDLGPESAAPFGEISSFGTHTRAFVKIQDGCDSRCSYCIVPFARGPNRSRPAEDVLRQISLLIDRGYVEIVLTGVHLGTWGRDLSPGGTLAALLERITLLPGLTRLRLSSIEPTEFTPALMDVLHSEKICPHLHIPLQSGSAKVLGSMGRPYRPVDYARIVGMLSDRIPDLGLGADVIAAFPGEGEEEHVETRSLIEDLPVSYLHVFPYSRRPGTPAAGLADQVAPEDRERRAAELRELGKGKWASFRKARIGRTYGTLIETRQDGDTGPSRGITGNYLKVFVDAPQGCANTVQPVLLTHFEGGKLYGEIRP
jgi:threonylcarbamoyladenosine tRNA methylthiotransferase MtaB